MRVSLIITTYNRPDALRLVLKSALEQECLPDEIIIADDGSTAETRIVIEKSNDDSPVPILHAWQPDEGFRAAMSRNRAIAMSRGDYIIFIDGDMLMHPLFIKDHKEHAEKGCFVQGSRVLLTEEATRRAIEQDQTTFSVFSPSLKKRKNAIRSKALSRIFSRRNRSLHGIRTCNFALFREEILSINGFDNRFVGWGREDSEFAARLFNNGLVRKDLRFAAIAYHLHHQESSRRSLAENDRRLHDTLETKRVQCEDGVERFIKESQ
jgi:glycosyltransferase involved in cell wall biosynthesis